MTHHDHSVYVEGCPLCEAWDRWVHETNPQLDRAGIRQAFIAGFTAGRAQ